MIWVLIIGGAWLLLAPAAALLIARAIRIADTRQPEAALATTVTKAAEPDRALTIPRPRSADSDRQRLPRRRTRRGAARAPLHAAERVPPTRSGTA
jgi:hypothetical protein